MARTYTLRKRAEKQAETRKRIVDAAIELHGSVGPAQTTFSMVAERAGVQRHTLYAHFPDELSLLRACSGTHLEAAPLPDPAPWRAIEPGGARLRVALPELYDWYRRNAAMTANVLRDAEFHAATREIAALRMGPVMRMYHEVLSEGLSGKQQALLGVALSFHTWRTLAHEAGLDSTAAAETMADAIDCGG